ncbi:MAG TPA: ribose-5-phosphate isomerase A [Clostridia bacterium]|nr:ribose-5-phosphate isomerase A [Clostridia bacterium]
MIEGGIADAPALAAALKGTVGVVEHGLFIAMTDTCIASGPDGPLAVGRLSRGAVV